VLGSHNESWNGDEKFRNLYQQHCGCINYTALIRPEMSYYASQICRVMSMPNEENLRVARAVSAASELRTREAHRTF
jgi:hypothetical protein